MWRAECIRAGVRIRVITIVRDSVRVRLSVRGTGRVRAIRLGLWLGLASRLSLGWRVELGFG